MWLIAVCEKVRALWTATAFSSFTSAPGLWSGMGQRHCWLENISGRWHCSSFSGLLWFQLLVSLLLASDEILSRIDLRVMHFLLGLSPLIPSFCNVQPIDSFGIINCSHPNCNRPILVVWIKVQRMAFFLIHQYLRADRSHPAGVAALSVSLTTSSVSRITWSAQNLTLYSSW